RLTPPTPFEHSANFPGESFGRPEMAVLDRCNWTGGTTGGTPRLDAHVHAGHLLGANPCRYWIVPFYTFVAMLLKMRESFVRDQGVGGSNPLAPIIKISWLRRV